MERNKAIRLAFWVLAYGIGPILILGLISGQFKPEMVGSRVFMGILAIAWMKLSKYGVRIDREMG